METRGATSAHHRRPAVERRFKSGCTLRRSCFRFACETTARGRSPKKYWRCPKLGDVRSMRRWICSFRARERCTPFQKMNQPRITIASQRRPHGRQSPGSIPPYPRSISAYPRSVPAYLGMPDNGKKNFFQPSVAFWTHSSRLSRRQETGRLWN